MLLAVTKRLQGLLTRKELASVFVMIFIADVVVGVFSPTFSLYATGLGASMTLVGVLSSVAGLTRILSSVPIGLLSDAKGRKGVLVSGMLLLATSSYLYTVVHDPYLLLPIRMIYGIVITSTFFIGMAYAGDKVAKADLGLTSGIYTSCMGLGFTLGSGLGGKMAAEFGYVLTFRVAAMAALAGAIIAWWGLEASPKRGTLQMRALPPGMKLGLLVKEPQLFAASLGYMLTILMFDATIVNFFPLYAKSLLISQATIGSMFAIRALASTSVRLPTGVLTSRIPSKRLMLIALFLGMIMLFSIGFLTQPIPLTMVLVGEGVCFGIFLTSGQSFINEHFGESDRGTAMGVYSTTGSISATAGPFVLGAIADLWGVRSVFWLTGTLVLVGIGVFLYTSSRVGPARVRQT